ncbi:PRTRC system ParB family protein [Pelobacter propionicus]|uniref:ParB family protein n=1 Tax=Pelobacter propionicus (strain DSM 2379 / NBRC 103807 / OttBd1) TaxID=338966 RepID=A0R7U3_PELPD|nr:PRTRC system ParB family protein [Pelobacter propionicus]ABL01408.1 ParB family protein [Pelobacter propionicus DSM 2379]
MESAVTKSHDLAHIPLGAIVTGNNPRQFFCPTAMEELIASVRQKGVIQPICLNVLEGGKYQIIAGERRYRAALEVYGAEGTIPAIVTSVDSSEADSMALIENAIRENMSPTEEAVAAGKMLAKNNNNRDETAAELGWHVSKLNRRLALLNLVAEAMTALNERRIMLGHAELLAAVPQDKQTKALETITAMKMPVQQVKELLAKASTAFESAIFDTARCASCQYNSEQQSALFTEAIESGRCTNQSCYDTKTRVRIEEIRDEVSQEVQTVKVIEIGDTSTTVCLTKDGGLGVGAEQFDACLACSKFGATVSAIPGEEGKIERSVCFDSDCHRKMVAERVKSEKANQSSSKENEGQTTPVTETETAPASATSKAKGTGTQKKASDLSERVKEYRRKQVWEPAVKRELVSQQDKARAFVLDLLLSGDAGKPDHMILVKLFGKITGGDYPVSAKEEGYPEKPYGLDSDQQSKLFAAAGVSAVGAIAEKRLKKLLGFLETDLGKYWKINQDFLSLLTKSEIESVCKNVGIDAVIKDFAKVIGGKKEEAIKTILNAEFDFEGAVPSMLKY